MTTTEIIEEIVKENKVEEVFKICAELLIEQKNNYQEAMTEYRACLTAIHKINKGKNDGIDALSEV